MNPEPATSKKIVTENTISFRVRYPEADPMGFVHHSRYLQYFEMGRIELLRAGGHSYAELEKAGVLFVVVKIEVKYKSPARFDDELTLITKTQRQTPVRIEHVYQLMKGQLLIAEGTSTIACVDSSGQLRTIPESLTIE
jgi:acyl-CoA thioester hydrolase